jgi:hypothetical protein
VPADVVAGGRAVNTDAWPTPFAAFPGTDCAIDSYFGPHRIVINLTLCTSAPPSPLPPRPLRLVSCGVRS